MNPIDLHVTHDYDIANGAATSTQYHDFRGAKRGMIYVPSAWTGADITFVVKDRKTAKQTTRGLLTAKSANLRLATSSALVKIANIKTAEAGWYPIPDEVFSGAAYVAIRSTNTGSEADATQGAARALVVSLFF